LSFNPFLGEVEIETQSSFANTHELFIYGDIYNITINFVKMCGEENQLDATQWFIELVICSTCFGHLYAHHQELETILLVTICGL
jgi:hypothetical protein